MLSVEICNGFSSIIEFKITIEFLYSNVGKLNEEAIFYSID
jgi:hypothetical protein